MLTAFAFYEDIVPGLRCKHSLSKNKALPKYSRLTAETIRGGYLIKVLIASVVIGLPSVMPCLDVCIKVYEVKDFK